MNSQDLERYGFKEWVPFNELPRTGMRHEGGVYILRLDTSFGRLNGVSDIVYVGSTTDFSSRFMKNYSGGTGGLTTQRIHDYLVRKGYAVRVSASWVATEDFQIERNLLKRYEEELHELPPWNRQG